MPFGCVAYEAGNATATGSKEELRLSPMPFGCVAYEAWLSSLASSKWKGLGLQCLSAVWPMRP